MPAVNGVGKPGAGEPHARIDGRELETERVLVKALGVEQPVGKPQEWKAPRPKIRFMPPRQLPTLLTHLCGKTKTGRFWLRRITISKRMRAKLREVNDQLKRRRHQPIPLQGQWLAAVVRGHLAYYAVPGNTDAVAAFRTQATRHWYKALRRRSQRTRLNWERMNRIATRWLPPARVKHPFPNVRFDARTRGRSPVR
jgi:hypothetical protein